MEFVTSQKRNRKIINNGYVYVFQKDLANDVRSYECELRRNKQQCKAKIKVDIHENIIGTFNEHTHPPSDTVCEVNRIKSRIRDLSYITQNPPQQILGEALQGISEDASVNLPAIDHMRRTIRHQRRDNERPVNPVNRDAIPVLPLMYQLTANNEQFLLFDSGVDDENRILMFASNQAIQLLAISEDWFGDGTFRVCPEIFFQLYTIHARINQRIIPCVYALLPNKTRQTYERMFREISDRVDAVGNAPLTFLIDFERATMIALNAIFPQTEISGCFFHLTSNIWKRIQAFGLQEQYQADGEFALHLRMIAALAFIPPDEVVNAFDRLCEVIRNTYQNDADRVLDYFEDTYIGRFRRNAPRAIPLFSIQKWNMFHRTHEEMPRTNNHIEGWHRRFQTLCSSSHPTLWKFLELLKREQSINRIEILQAQGGHPPPAQRRRYVDCNQRILAIVDDYANRDHMQYLRSIAHNLGF